jgi:hypothetical protein
MKGNRIDLMYSICFLFRRPHISRSQCSFINAKDLTLEYCRNGLVMSTAILSNGIARFFQD